MTNFLLEHDGELFESLFGHASGIAGLDLLFQIVFHAHGQLIQLIPLLGKIHCAVFRVSRSTTHHMLVMQVYKKSASSYRRSLSGYRRSNDREYLYYY